MMRKVKSIRNDGIEKQGIGLNEVEVIQFDEDGLIDVEVEGEVDLDEKLQPDDCSEEEKDFSSSTDDDNPAWIGGLVTFSEDDIDMSLEEDLKVENDDQNNP